MDNPETPRKRKRTEAMPGDADDTSGSLNSAQNDPIVRDETYYKEKGDCVILVGRVLFKIHRYLLERDASAFLNMFALPQDDESTQSTSDEDPLILHDDVDDFRALCWIMYALPTVHMQQYRIATANVKNLIGLYLISQKYHFEAHETFARELLRRHCTSLQNKQNTASFLFSCPESRLESLLRIATLTDPTSMSINSLSSALQKIWIVRLEKAKQSACFALTVGEELGLRNFTAELYYFELSKMETQRLASGAYSHPTNDLTPSQKLVLYQGYWSLRHWWSDVLESAPRKTFFCPPNHDCSLSWTRGWDRAISDEKTSKFFHPMQSLKSIEERIHMGYYAQIDVSLTEARSECAIRVLTKMTTELKDALANHFHGPLLPSAPDA
ncbi:hypothetical protein BDN70DRAFT_873637 [Pholiota conissans]|uniref:BTB domain-containing protein n=1 Tax=Pholiota conissans TaxID=109636 RepID=A0A9P6D4Z7_9AGAR|nr:hypothetical protein BDN70DRAFT_873637 [Pholiota conissans]